MGWPKFIWDEGSGPSVPRCPICGKPLAFLHRKGEFPFFPQSVCLCARTENPGELFAQALDIQRLPGRTSLRRDGSGWEIACSNPSFASIYWWLFLAITVTGLPGFGDWRPFAWLLGPFALSNMLWLTFGRVIIRWDARCCYVFSGCWHIGRRHQFEWAHLYELRRTINWFGSYHFGHYRVIVLVADGIFEFGRSLTDDQRTLIIAMPLGKGALPRTVA